MVRTEEPQTVVTTILTDGNVACSIDGNACRIVDSTSSVASELFSLWREDSDAIGVISSNVKTPLVVKSHSPGGAKQEMESLMASKSNAQHALASLDSAIAQCKETMEQVEKRKKAVDSEIENSLKQVRTALLTQSENIRLKKIRGLQVQVQELQKVRDGIYLASRMIDDAQSHSPAQQLSTKKVLAERATKLQKEFKASVLLPSQGANFVTGISDPATISKMISLGCVSGEGYPPNSTCDAGYVPCGVVGKPRTIRW